jgi:hypothetical protein
MDPLERSLSAAPMLTLSERRSLWKSMMEAEAEDPVGFITGWFFDEPIESISKYDVRDFFVWSMFESRNQEHLTLQELDQREDFVDEIEWRISLQLFGAGDDEEPEEEEKVGAKTMKLNETKHGDTHTMAEESGDDKGEQDAVMGRDREQSDSLIMKPKEHSAVRRDDRYPRPKQSKWNE